MDGFEDIPVPTITSWDEAETWIGRHQRWLVQDAERMAALEDRLRRLERRPWWRRRGSR